MVVSTPFTWMRRQFSHHYLVAVWSWCCTTNCMFAGPGTWTRFYSANMVWRYVNVKWILSIHAPSAPEYIIFIRIVHSKIDGRRRQRMMVMMTTTTTTSIVTMVTREQSKWKRITRTRFSIAHAHTHTIRTHDGEHSCVWSTHMYANVIRVMHVNTQIYDVTELTYDLRYTNTHSALHTSI